MMHLLFRYGFESVIPYAHNRDFDTPNSTGVNVSYMAAIEPK